MSKILVTGGAGFIGSHLTDALIDQGHEVFVVDNLSSGKKENLNQKAVFFEMDINNKELSGIFEKERPEAVFHFAAQTNVRRSVEDPIFDARTNIVGTLNILENCRKFGVKKIIFASSGGAIYGEPEIIPTPENAALLPCCPYGVSKLAGEKYLYFYDELFGIAHVILRFSNIYGPRQDPEGEAGVVAVFTNTLLKNKPCTIFGDGLQIRDFLFVKDAVGAAVLSLDFLSKQESSIFNVGTGISTNINETYNLVLRHTGGDAKPEHGPVKEGDSRKSCLECGKIKEQLGWSPKYTLEQGIEETVKWFKNEN